MDGAPRYDARGLAELLPGTLRIVSVRMNYLPANAARVLPSTLEGSHAGATLADMRWGVIITKLLRGRLKNWASESAVLLRFAEF